MRETGEPLEVIQKRLGHASIRTTADVYGSLPVAVDKAASDRLLTTILDPKRAPAQELAALYPERWEFETALDELKTHQRSPRVVLRSKMPDGVTQEVYGYLCVHYAVRWLMHSVAHAARGDPDRLSFTRTLRVARRTTVSHLGFSP